MSHFVFFLLGFVCGYAAAWIFGALRELHTMRDTFHEENLP